MIPKLTERNTQEPFHTVQAISLDFQFLPAVVNQDISHSYVLFYDIFICSVCIVQYCNSDAAA